MATKPEDDTEVDLDTEDKILIEEEDDTPQEDRGREPMPKDITEELDADELEEYSAGVKDKLKKYKKVWHDERREKERLARENQEAISLGQRLFEENKRLKQNLSQGEGIVVKSFIDAAELESQAAEKAYREAYDSGDTEKLTEAQKKMTQAEIKLSNLRGYKPTLQPEENEIPNQVTEQVQVPRPDAKTVAWQKRNDWFGSDPEMTAAALGLHQKLINEHGTSFNGTDKYWAKVDETMHQRFSEYFEEAEPKPRERASNVVAPATRSTSPRKIKLTTSQLAIAKKFGLTKEQYAQEVLKLEQKND